MRITINIEAKPYMCITQKELDFNSFKAQAYLNWQAYFRDLLSQYLKQEQMEKWQEIYNNLLCLSGIIYISHDKYKQEHLSDLIRGIEDACQGICYNNRLQIKEYRYWKMLPISKDEMPKIVLEIEIWR